MSRPRTLPGERKYADMMNLWKFQFARQSLDYSGCRISDQGYTIGDGKLQTKGKGASSPFKLSAAAKDKPAKEPAESPKKKPAGPAKAKKTPKKATKNPADKKKATKSPAKDKKAKPTKAKKAKSPAKKQAGAPPPRRQ
ncbi:histone H1.10-like [Pollicipes pollicipes]|uniref:histone H1.10-like n=1 Tax=Pollicipes pollicipes TaxID=41117 RepID=UPI0018849081|nr:histone H1.10-like [Pollicipes pollicipes]